MNRSRQAERLDDVRARSLTTREVPVRGGAFRVVGLDDLIRMKRAAGRDKDLDDIAALTHHERRP